jgi:hypothetical protein
MRQRSLLRCGNILAIMWPVRKKGVSICRMLLPDAGRDLSYPSGSCAVVRC